MNKLPCSRFYGLLYYYIGPVWVGPMLIRTAIFRLKMTRKKPSNSEANNAEKRKKERERKRKYREKLKNDLDRVEQIKKNDRERKRKSKEEGKIKSISEMSNREKRLKRKQWKLATRRYRDNLKRRTEADVFLCSNTPPNSPNNNFIPEHVSSSKKKTLGQKRVRNRREKDKRNLEKANKTVERIRREREKWRKKYLRLKEKISPTSALSPQKITNNIMRSGKKEVRRNLMIGVALQMQLQANALQCTSQAEKKILLKIFLGKLLLEKN